MNPPYAGAWFVCTGKAVDEYTPTAIGCVAVKLASLAVTVTVVSPSACPVNVTIEPDTLTVTLVVSADTAA